MNRMASTLKNWMPTIVSAALTLIVPILSAATWLIYTNTVTINTVATRQPDMTAKLNDITNLLGGLQTRAAARRQHNELSKRINRNADDIGNLRERVSSLESKSSQ